MAKDNGGWRSKGSRVVCPRCSNDDATLIESVIYGNRSTALFCRVCSKEFEDPDAQGSDK